MARDEAPELVRSCGTSCEETPWRRFVDSYAYRLRMTVLQNLLRFERRAPSETVDELVQEVYCRLLQHDRRALRDCRARSNSAVMGYLATVCSSVVVDYLRACATLKRGGALGQVASAIRSSQAVEDLSDPAASPERNFMLREARRIFLDSCARVFVGASRERNLEIFKLAFVDGWTSREISERFAGAIKPGSIDSMIHRHRRLLNEVGVAVPER